MTISIMAKIIINRNNCIGCGSCAALCEKYFEMAEDGKSHLKNSTRTAEGNDELEVDSADCASSAAEACPAQCISIK
jgi:ferredoxin